VKVGALFILAGLAGARCAAADAPICASRPGKSTPPCTVPAGHFQLETGLADWSLDKDQGQRDMPLAVGETVFKYGLSNRSDIEFDMTPWRRSGGRDGLGDIVVGFKQALVPGGAVQVALQPFVKAPTASHAIGNGKWEGGLMLPIGIALGHSALSLALTPEVDWAADASGHGHHLAMAQVASFAWAVNDTLSLSAELWGELDWDPEGTARQASADGSIAYLLNNDMQIDAGANLGLDRETPDVELYAGVSKRF